MSRKGHSAHVAVTIRFFDDFKNDSLVRVAIIGDLVLKQS